MSTATHFEIADLLPLAGATPPRYGRGKWDCPRCGGRGCLSVDAGRGLYHCFHGGCGFAGNTEMLARELGLAQRMPRAESVRQHQEQELRRDAAQRLYAVVHQLQLKLQEELRTLGRLEIAAHAAGPCEASWHSLERVYTRRPVVESALAFVESASAAELLSETDRLIPASLEAENEQKRR